MIKYKDFYGNELNVTEDYLVELLKRVYNGEIGSIYIAATLMCDFEGVTLDFNIKPDIIDRLNYWVCKLYIKNKTPNHHYWKEAHKIVKHCKERNLI